MSATPITDLFAREHIAFDLNVPHISTVQHEHLCALLKAWSEICRRIEDDNNTAAVRIAELERELEVARRDALAEAVDACEKVYATWGDDAKHECMSAIRTLYGK